MSSPDHPRWLMNRKGTFSVKDAYLFDQKDKFLNSGELSPSEWKKLWRLMLQHCLKVLLWKVVANALSLRGISGPQVAMPSSLAFSCPLCNGPEESQEHLFLGCLIRVILWRTGPWPF